jgi:hypothetical protein
MRWFQAAVAILSVLVMTGCPSEFGKDGRVSKAVHKDAREQLGLTGCSDRYRWEVCEGPNKDPQKCQACD